MKKRSVILATLALALVLTVGGTMAWFTAESDPVVNKFEAGTLDIELVDKFKGAVNVNPGDSYRKEVYVKNTGTKRAYVRVKVDSVFDNEELSTDVIKYGVNNILGIGWVKKGDYFYYNHVVYPGHSTSPLFSGNRICFDGPSMGNEYQGAKLDITIKADAVQITNGAPRDVWSDAPFLFPLSVEDDLDLDKQLTEEDVQEMIQEEEVKFNEM